MPNINADAYALTLVCPIKNGYKGAHSFTSLTREYLQGLKSHHQSPMANVPNTFMCRFYILNDVFYEGSPAQEDHLKSRYLVFSCDFHGLLQPYLEGFWDGAQDDAKMIWQYCVGFDAVIDCNSFVRYVKQCQVDTTYYFNGSSGAPLREQLKALYLKQELSQFVIENQGLCNVELQKRFAAFIERCQPNDDDAPSWYPGMNFIYQPQS